MSKARRNIAAGKFKAGCLQILDQVELTGETVIVTKRGRPVAQLTPLREKSPRSLRKSVKFHGDILEPIGEMWDVEQ